MEDLWEIARLLRTQAPELARRVDVERKRAKQTGVGGVVPLQDLLDKARKEEAAIKTPAKIGWLQKLRTCLWPTKK